MSGLLTTASTLMCPHGGSVSIVSANTKVSAGAALALASDTFTIAGCSFQLSGAPHPCLTVQWVLTNTKTMVNSTPTLSLDSQGLCLAADQAAQGPVSIVNTQPTVGGL
jgi:hypothetical protein